MKKFIALCVLLIQGLQVFAATVLTPGDVVILTVNSDLGLSYPAAGANSNGFDFLTRVPLDAGTEIFFSDNAWNGTGWRVGGEGVLRYTVPAGGITAGTIVHYEDSVIAALPSSGTGTWDMYTINDITGLLALATNASDSFDPAIGGDNILVFQGASTSPTFVYGIGWSAATTWISTSSPSTNNSYIPTGISAAANTVVTLGSVDNYRYNCANLGIFSSNFLSSILTTGNWVSNDTIPYGPISCSFDIIRPSVTINQSVGQNDPTNVSTMNFTVVFSEAINPSSFTASDITLSGTGSATVGTPTTTDNITWTLPVTATAGGTIIASLAEGVVTDSVGNPNTASTSTDNTITFDATAPTVTELSTSTANGTYGPGSSIALTATLSEPVTGGTITLTLGNSMTATLTCTANACTGTYTVGATGSGEDATDLTVTSYTSAGVTDIAGNTMTSTALPASPADLGDNEALVIDTTAPTISMSSVGGDSTSPYITSDTSTDIVLSVSPGDTVTMTGWTCTPSPATGTSVTCIPSSPLADGSYTYTINITDAVGNSTSGSLSFTVDTALPLITITAPTKASNATITNTTLTITDASGILVGDVAIDPTSTVSWANLSCVQTSAIEVNCTLDITASGDLIVNATDTLGNGPASGTELNYIIDTVAPTVTITDDEAGVATSAGGPVLFTFTFSEPVTGFTPSDVILQGGTGGTWTAVSSTVYTYEITPNPLSTTDIIIDIAIGSLTDTVGNANTVAFTASQAVDTLPPTLPTCVASPNPSNQTTLTTIACTGAEENATLTIPGTTCAPTPATAAGSVICTSTSMTSVSVNPSVTIADIYGNSATGTVPYTLDLSSPVLTLSSTAPSIVSGVFEILITPSEPIVGLTLSDIQISNSAIIESLSGPDVSGAYILSIRPTNNGIITCSIGANTVTDSAGNPNLAPVSLSREYTLSGGGIIMTPTNNITNPVVTTSNTTSQAPIPQAHPLPETAPANTVATIDTSVNNDVCTPYLTSYIFANKENNPEDVIRLQQFLNTYEGTSLAEDGTYDADDIEAVKNFQKKYVNEILRPWGHSNPTGNVYQTTTAKINLMMCAKHLGCPYFTEYKKLGENGHEVGKIINFLDMLNDPIHVHNTVSNEQYDVSVVNRVKSFQTRYKDAVLKPWELKQPTGWWYQTSRYAANKLMGCTDGLVQIDNGIKLD